MSGAFANTAIPAARRFAAFASGVQPPGEVLDAVGCQVLDTIGICLAGHTLHHRPRIENVALSFGAGAATALGSREPVSAPAAALFNGCLAHGLEADDTHIGAVMHGSSILVPAALAAAEEQDADGQTLLWAVALGWEVAIRIGLGFPEAFFKNGFHATALGGPFAAAVVAGVVRGLTEDQFVSALGIAGSQSSGVFEFMTDGANSKWLHGGWPALGGLVAASLAQSGMTGPETIFEGRAGFARAFARQEDAATFVEACDDLGAVWHCRDVAVKLYPTCHFIQPFLECTEILLRDTPADRIASITCFVPEGAAALICEPWHVKLRPVTIYQAKWSLPYCVANLLVHGSIDVATFDRQDPDETVMAVANKVRFEVARTSFPRHLPGRIRAVLVDGVERTIAVDDVLGSPSRPLGNERLTRKFRDNTRASLIAGGADDVIAAVEGLRDGISARDLGRTLRAATIRPSGRAPSSPSSKVASSPV
ncbi:MAG: hypothetical protein BGN87_23530 [Rhizobiales bacterium 65-79]|jgi:2-methylcitrate dehydratase PrpD|nr:MmgE/PrpD family protein [Hyphomicrobiales bacterium]OJU01420.1 MAG: hypothetical protein BGN87_23530 [Rhizobiales bacterium 65-79]